MKRKGFTLVELLIFMAFAAVIGSVGVISFIKARNRNDFDKTKTQIIAILSDAQGRAVSQADGKAWGVRFDNNSQKPFFALFSDFYSASNVVSSYALPNNISFGTTTLPRDTSKDIVFKEITGFASGTVSIQIFSSSAMSSATISVSTSGIVQY